MRKPVLRFSLTIAFVSSVWVFVTQADKLVLSRILPLADYGYFTLAVLVASGIMVLSGPIGNAVMPRMAKLEAEGAHAQLIQVYRHATQLVTVVAGAASITVAFSAEALLRAWTGNLEMARQAAPVLVLYAVGNGILAVSAFPYYLQFAKGDLRLHVIGNAAFVVLLIPLVIWSATKFGGVGAGYVWLGMNLFSFVAWLPFVHRKFEPGLNLRWYVNDIAVKVMSERVQYYGNDGKLITESLKDYTRKAVLGEFASLDKFLQRWTTAEQKQAVLTELERQGVFFEELAEQVGKDLDPFDLVCHVAFDQPPLTRRERADNVKKRNYFAKYGEQARAVLEALLDKYADEGIGTIETFNVLKVQPLDKFGTPVEIVKLFGGKDQYEKALRELETALYALAQ